VPGATRNFDGGSSCCIPCRNVPIQVASRPNAAIYVSYPCLAQPLPRGSSSRATLTTSSNGKNTLARAVLLYTPPTTQQLVSSLEGLTTDANRLPPTTNHLVHCPHHCLTANLIRSSTNPYPFQFLLCDSAPSPQPEAPSDCNLPGYFTSARPWRTATGDTLGQLVMSCSEDDSSSPRHHFHKPRDIPPRCLIIPRMTKSNGTCPSCGIG
jgi:hypothetical protein